MRYARGLLQYTFLSLKTSRGSIAISAIDFPVVWTPIIVFACLFGGYRHSFKCRVCGLPRPHLTVARLFERQLALNSFAVDKHTMGLELSNLSSVQRAH